MNDQYASGPASIFASHARRYKIAKVTLCSVDNHVFLYAGDSITEWPPDLKCDCGEFTWGELIDQAGPPTEQA